MDDRLSQARERPAELDHVRELRLVATLPPPRVVTRFARPEKFALLSKMRKPDCGLPAKELLSDGSPCFLPVTISGQPLISYWGFF